MLGWHIIVSRQKDNHQTPATFADAHGMELAVWQTNASGRDWIEELVKQQKAISLGGNGYPFEYTAMARHITPIIVENPPNAKAVWSFDAGDILLPGWAGKTVIHPKNIAECYPNEWLIIQIWDES